MKVGSILILSNAKEWRYDKEEYPDPKSSSAIRTPRALSRERTDTAREKSSINTLSVISSSSLVGGRSVSSRIKCTRVGRLPERNCSGDTFTATVRGWRQPAASRQASRKAHSPSVTISALER